MYLYVLFICLLILDSALINVITCLHVIHTNDLVRALWVSGWICYALRMQFVERLLEGRVIVGLGESAVLLTQQNHCTWRY